MHTNTSTGPRKNWPIRSENPSFAVISAAPFAKDARRVDVEGNAETRRLREASANLMLHLTVLRGQRKVQKRGKSFLSF